MAMPIQKFETATISGWPCITHDGKAWRFGAAYQNLSTAKLADELNAIVDKINKINDEWVMVETNSGTFGSEEACRVQGNGDPVRSTYYIDEQVGSGQTRRRGLLSKNAPGRGIIGRKTIEAKRREVRELEKQIEKIKKDHCLVAVRLQAQH